MKAVLSPRDVVSSGLCIGCGACVSQSEGTGKMSIDTFGQLKPSGSTRWLRTRSLAVGDTCPFSPEAINEDQLSTELFPDARERDGKLGRYETAYVGYVAEGEFREHGSSGGMVTWVAAELLRKGLIDGVAHVTAVDDPQAEERFFKYRISRTSDQIREGAKSRYYPIEMSEILGEMKREPGRYLVVGIPCFIKAIQLLRRSDPVLRERIAFTLGLFCGHMKSARFIESFAWQMDVPLNEVARVDFRHKDPQRPANWYNARLTLRDGSVVNKDWWHLADGDWGAGFFQNSACDYCDDVVAETADVSFGDAWVEPYSSDGRGTNVVIVRSPEVRTLIEHAIAEGRLHLDRVDSDLVVRTQAAGFRQRGEGLAYRLSQRRRGLTPRKRVLPSTTKLSLRRKLIYRMRQSMSKWSHRVFIFARFLRLPALYINWAKAAAGVYHPLAYPSARLKKLADSFAKPRAD